MMTAVREHVSVLWRDVSYAFRTMRRTPAFTAMAVLMLAVGTGANVAMFSVIDAVVLRSPFIDPDRLVMIRVAQPDGRMNARMTADQFTALSPATPGLLRDLRASV